MSTVILLNLLLFFLCDIYFIYPYLLCLIIRSIEETIAFAATLNRVIFRDLYVALKCGCENI